MKCKYIYKNGQLKGKQCPHEALPDSDFCKWHESKDGKDFSRQEIQETDLAEAYLEKANLQEAKFKKEADLSYANLQGANLVDADLQRAYLYNADLQRANLYNAKLQETDLDSANLQRAYLDFAKLQEAYLGSANLQGAHLDLANLQEAHLVDADLQRAGLGFANLQGAYLDFAKLQETDLDSANLQGANLSHTDLTNTLFDSETDLRGAFLCTAEIKNAKGLQYAEISGRNAGEQCTEEFIADKLDRILNSKKSFEEVLEEILTPELRTLGFTDKADKIVVSHITKGTGFDLQYIINSKGKNSKYKGIEPKIDFYNKAKDVYINLKNYFKNAGFYDESGIFFIGEFRVRGKIYKALGDEFRYALWERIQRIFHKLVFWKHYEEMDEIPLQEKKSANLLWNMLANYFAFSMSRLLSITSLYGESVWRILFTALSIVFFYASVYSLKGSVIGQNMAKSVHNFWTNLYFSIVTFTTLGYGDLHPVPSIGMRLFAGSEAFLGAFILAYFVVIVSRKIMR